MKFSLVTMRGTASRTSEPSQFAFFLTRAAQLRDESRTFPLRPEDFARINPNTKTCPIFRTRADADLTRRIYDRVPVLVNEVTGENPWDAQLISMFHMANDSTLFSTRSQLEASGLNLHGTRFTRGRQVYQPLYEAKMIHQFNHRFGNCDTLEERSNVSLPTPDARQYQDAGFAVLPWYWVENHHVEAKLSAWSRDWLLGFRSIARATDERTMIASVFPRSAVSGKMPCLLHHGVSSALLGNLNCLVFDFAARQKVGGTDLAFFYVRQFPVLPPSAYSAADLLFIVPRVLELTATTWDVQPFADDVWRDAGRELRAAIERQWRENCRATGGHRNGPPEWYTSSENGFQHPPFRWSDERRATLRAELDAWYARLYGLDERDLRYILDPEDVYGPGFAGETFRVLKKNEIERYGEYRTQRLVLEALHALEPASTSAVLYFAEQMQKAVQAAYERIPISQNWGFYSYGDGPVDRGGGTGGFLWFESRDRMFDFIREYLPFWFGHQGGAEARQTAAKIREILGRVGAAPAEPARTELNRALEGSTQVVWWGRFDELLGADTPFAREVRDWFWSNGGQNGAGAVPRNRAGEFAQELQNYGI
jgi:hypothetical protein